MPVGSTLETLTAEGDCIAGRLLGMGCVVESGVGIVIQWVVVVVEVGVVEGAAPRKRGLLIIGLEARTPPDGRGLILTPPTTSTNMT